jgi:hypothetical protein
MLSLSRSRSNQIWKKSNAYSRRKSRSRSRSRQYSRRHKFQDFSKQSNVANWNLSKISLEIPKVNPEDNVHTNNSSKHQEEKKDSNIIVKKSEDQENKILIDEKLIEELERKKKFLNEFLKIKESDSTDLKLKLPKLIDKEKLKNLNDSQHDLPTKPNLSLAFKKLEETNRLKGIATQSIGYSRNGNYNINIHRRESSYNDMRVDSYYDSYNRNSSGSSSWRKNYY